MVGTTELAMFGALMVTVLMSIALLCGHDGQILMAAIATISGLCGGAAGYTLGTKKTFEIDDD